MSTRAVRLPWPERAIASRADRAAPLALRAAVASRVIVWMAGLAALAAFGRGAGALSAFDPHGLTEPFRSGTANFLLAPAARWDSAWYLEIVRFGYSSRAASAFFPLYPLLVRAAAPVFGSAIVAGAAISFGSLTGALYLIARLVRCDLDERVARATVVLLAFFPTAFFLSAVYSESLFLLVSLGAVYAARRGRWDYAGLLGGAAALTRPNGVLVVLPVAMLYLCGTGWRPSRRIGRSALWLGLIPLGLGLYLVYAALVWGNPLEPFAAQSLFDRAFAGVFGAVVHAVARAPADVAHLVSGAGTSAAAWDPVNMELHRLVDLGFLAFAAIGVALSRRGLPAAYLVYSLAMLASSTSYPSPDKPLEAFPRYALVLFPAFIGWAAWLSTGRRRARLAFGASVALLALFSGLWAIWSWVA